MQLQVNQVYRDISKEKLFRILALSTEKDIAIVIQINDERDLKLPIEVNYSELYEQINQGSYEIIEDPIRLLSETQLTTIQIERTDKIWRLIRGFVSDQTQCFDKKKRRQFIKEISEAEGLRPETVQSWLHRYWAGGSMKAALIPNYRAKGAPGKQRLETKERVGRKGKYQSDSQKMKVGETELEQISWVMNHYYNKNTKYGMNYCYKKLIEKYYTDQVSGMVQDPHPTFEQFKYRAYKLLNLKKRLGEKKVKRVLGIIKSILVWIFVIFAVSMTIFTVISVNTFNRNDRSILGYKAYIVNTDSMSKTDFKAGDLILVKETDPSTLKAGDIITYMSQNSESFGETITHKIRKVTTDSRGNPGFITYSTTTDQDDDTIVTYMYVLGKYEKTIPNIGTFFNFMKTPQGYILCIFVPFMLLIIYQAVNFVMVFRRYKREQLEELNAEKERIETEREQNAQMMEELRALKQQLESKVVSENKEEKSEEAKNETKA